MFDFLKKKADAPPDVGKEAEFDAEKGDKEEKEEGEESEMPDVFSPGKKGMNSKISELSKGGGSGGGGVVSAASDLQMEKIGARIESVVEWINQFYERFSYVSERIGEVRNMSMTNEKKISELGADVARAIDVMKEVKPEKFRMDYQKLDIRIRKLEERIIASKEFMQDILREISDLKNKAEVFVGTDGVLKLNEEVKKDLIEIQKLNSKVKMHADKAEQIFVELREGFADYQKLNGVVDTLNSNYGGLQKEIERVQIEHGDVVRNKDLREFTKEFGAKLAVFNQSAVDVDDLKKKNQELNSLIENVLSVSRRNEEDIGKIGLRVGSEDVKPVSEYQVQLKGVLEIMDNLTKEIFEIKKKMNMKRGKVKEMKRETGKMKRDGKKEAEKIIEEDKKLGIKKSEEVVGKESVIDGVVSDKNGGEVEESEAEKVEEVNENSGKSVDDALKDFEAEPKVEVKKVVGKKVVKNGKKVVGKK